MAVGYLASQKRAELKAISNALAYGFDNCGGEEGQPMTQEIFLLMCRLAAEKLALFHLQRSQPESIDGVDGVE
jgi:hypothetical protein